MVASRCGSLLAIPKELIDQLISLIFGPLFKETNQQYVRMGWMDGDSDAVDPRASEMVKIASATRRCMSGMNDCILTGGALI